MSLAAIVGCAGYLSFASVAPMIGAPSPIAAAFDVSQVPKLDVSFPSESGVTASLADRDTVDLAGTKPLPTRHMGRVVPVTSDGTSHRSLRHQWPSVYFEARFKGDTLIVPFDDDLNRFRLTFGGKDQPSILISKPGKSVLRVKGLENKIHHVRLEKISESLSGARDFLGFFVPATAEPLVPSSPARRQIEFIGDSDTVGYGNLSSGRDCDGDAVAFRTDTSRSFGPMVARRFDADYQIIASSGIGLIRSLDGSDPESTMSVRYTQDLFGNPASRELENWTPQIIVLGLGPNDFETGISPDERWSSKQDLRADFETRLLTFLQDLRARTPDALFVLLEFQDYDREYLKAYRTVSAEFGAQGDDRILSVQIPKMQKTGCHWHPSLADHHMIAERIEKAVVSFGGGVWSSEVTQ